MTLAALGADGCLAAARQLVDEEPGAAAVRCAGVTLTRADLHERARSIAGHLAAAGAGPDRVVGVLTERSLDLPVAQLAAWYAGSGFLTLDPALPPARIAEMIDCAAPVAVVCAAQLRELLPEGLPTVSTTAPAGPVVDPPAVIGAHLSYVIHTSGSTGRAKAVGVTNANLAAALRGWEQRYELREHRDRVLQVASPGFDVAAGDFARTVLGGGCLVLPTRADLLDPVALDRLLRTEHISYLEITPSLLRAFCAGLDALRPVPSLRCLIVGGERFDAEDCRSAWQLLGPRGRLFNTYGLTECTIDTTVAELHRADTHPAGVPLGRPFPGTDLAVLDGELRPADSGQAYVGGDFVSRGYLGDPATTAQRFVPDPTGRAGERMFRSGDRVCRGSGGELRHLGRTDHQIKISGVRVDLAEIERVLTDLPAIGTSAAVVAGAGPGRQIVAHVVPAPGQYADAVAIRAELRDVLPAVMVPADVVVHDRLPVTGNGKIDRTALRSARNPAVPDLPPPRTRAGRIAALMSELLGAEVGPDDDFFGLGGSSLLATVLLGRLRSALHLALPDPGALWENPTPRALALACADAADGPRAVGAEIARLSPGQQRMWLTARLRPDDPSATVCVVLDLTGAVDESAVERAVTALTARHPALRTVVHIGADGAPVGQVLRAWPGRLVLLDGAGHPAEIAKLVPRTVGSRARPALPGNAGAPPRRRPARPGRLAPRPRRGVDPPAARRVRRALPRRAAAARPATHAVRHCRLGTIARRLGRALGRARLLARAVGGRAGSAGRPAPWRRGADVPAPYPHRRRGGRRTGRTRAAAGQLAVHRAARRVAARPARVAGQPGRRRRRPVRGPAGTRHRGCRRLLRRHGGAPGGRRPEPRAATRCSAASTMR